MMTEQEDVNAAQTTAQQFFDAMLAWELWRPSVDDMDDVSEQSLAKLRPIFEEYLSKKALSRHQSRYDLLAYGDPPEFSRKIVRAETAGKDKVWIYVPVGAIGGHTRFLVKKEDGKWKLDSKERDVTNKGVWKKILDF